MERFIWAKKNCFKQEREDSYELRNIALKKIKIKFPYHKKKVSTPKKVLKKHIEAEARSKNKHDCKRTFS